MADIIFRYPEMRAAARNVAELAERFKTAAERFENDFVDSVSDWEGTSKDKLQNFITGPVNEYISVTVPKLVNALAELLEANADMMEKVDQQIADSIPAALS